MFRHDYQRWYTKVLKAVASLAPDRHAEFRSYYEVDPKRKTLGYSTYVIQGYIKGVAPNSFIYPNFDIREQTLMCFFNQLSSSKQSASASPRFWQILKASSTQRFRMAKSRWLDSCRRLAFVPQELLLAY